MNAGEEIVVHGSGFSQSWQSAAKDEVWHLVVHGAHFPSALRSRPPRIRVIEGYHPKGTRCELLDPFPGCQGEWPIQPKSKGLK